MPTTCLPITDFFGKVLSGCFCGFGAQVNWQFQFKTKYVYSFVSPGKGFV